jgi:hypothetical protein
VRILRYQVPVDDDDHELMIHRRIVHVACRRRDVVELWAVDAGPRVVRRFRVFGTGHEFDPVRYDYVGTGIVPGGDLVWHLMERV